MLFEDIDFNVIGIKLKGTRSGYCWETDILTES